MAQVKSVGKVLGVMLMLAACLSGLEAQTDSPEYRAALQALTPRMEVRAPAPPTERWDVRTAIPLLEVALAGAEEPAEQAKINLLLGLLYCWDGQIDKAIGASEAVIAYDPTLEASFPELKIHGLNAMACLGDCYRAKGDWATAIHWWEKVMKLHPDAQAPMAMIHYGRTRLGEASAATQPLVDYRVQILQLKPLGAKPLTLSPDHFLTTGADGQTKRVPVVMERQVFEIRGIIEDGERSNEWSGKVECYELCSTNPQAPYSYSFHITHCPQRDQPPPEGAWRWPPDRFQLFSQENGTKFLAVAHNSLVLLMNVSKPNDKVASIKEHIVSMVKEPVQIAHPAAVALKGGVMGRGAGAVRPVPVTQLFGSWPFAYAVGPHHITIEDVSRNEAGHLVVSVSGIKSDKVYTLIFDGENWRKE